MISDLFVPHPPAGDSSNRIATTGFVADSTRELLTSARTYYIRTDGSDSNNGLANTAAGAFLTLQKAWDVIVGNLDLGGFDVTAQIGNGTYTGGVAASSSQTGAGNITFQGDTVTPANVIISTTGTHCFNVSVNGAKLIVAGMELRTTGSGRCLLAQGGGLITFGAGVQFGTCAGTQIRAIVNARVTDNGSSYTIVGGASAHLDVDTGGVIDIANATATLTGSLNFSTAFANATGAGIISCNISSYTGGTITGTRYSAALNAVINTFGGGASFFPGNAAGTTTTGGQYA